MYTIYNVDKKQAVAVFKKLRGISGYLYNEHSTHSKSHNKITNALRNRSKLIDCVNVNFPVAIRYANTVQRDLLGSADFIVLNNK